MAERVQLIGGQLEVSSQEGKGTTVMVRVPTELYAGAAAVRAAREITSIPGRRLNRETNGWELQPTMMLFLQSNYSFSTFTAATLNSGI